jgi:hypothetical protein
MIQNSLERLFAGMATSLREVVLPALDDDFASTQVSACIDLLGNLSTRVEWRADQLEATIGAARSAVEAAVTTSPALGDRLGPVVPADNLVAERDGWLERVSRAIEWCDNDQLNDATREPLVVFARWHLQTELTRLRTGMFSG